MRKIITSMMTIVVIILILFGTQHYLSSKTGTNVSSDKVLNLYNWGDYIDPALLKKFTQETGYRVSYETVSYTHLTLPTKA